MSDDTAQFASLDEAARKRFESAWRDGRPEPIESFLPPTDHPHYLATLEELVLIELEFAWKGRRGTGDSAAETPSLPRVESYLERFPQLRTPGVVRRLLAEEHQLRHRHGGHPDPAEYAARLADVTPDFGDPGDPAANPGREPKLPGYEIQSLVRRGGMGIVYKARQVSLGRTVAVKMIRDEAGGTAAERTRFQTEVETVARLQHPNIVQVHEVGEHDGQPFFSMEFVDGPSLADEIRGEPQPARPAAALLETLARAMDAVHQAGIVHRDLKPANVLLSFRSEGSIGERRGVSPPVSTADTGGLTPRRSPTGGSRLNEALPKITDFGLAKRLHGGGATRTGDVLGTPSYMAPEQAAGKKDVGPAADVYALGAILYEALTGHPPFKGETPLDTLAQVTALEPVPLRQLRPDVPRDLETICLKCLHKEPQGRYRSAGELADDLGRFQRDEPIRARPLGPVGRLLKWARRRPAVAGLLAVVVVSVAVGFALVSWKWLEAEQERERADDQRRQTETALGEAKKARAEAEERQRQAERAEERARKSADAERAARGKADRLAGSLAFAQGHALGTQGEAGRALLWLARGLNVADQAGDADLARAARAALAAWQRRHFPLTAVVPYAASGPSLAWAPDGRTFFTAGGGNAALFWDRDTGKPRQDLLFRHPGLVTAVAVSPDGKAVLTGSQDGSVRLWETASGRPLTDPLPHRGHVWAVAFSPDGKTLLVGSSDAARGEARLWDAATGKPRGDPLPHPRSVRAVALSPDGATVLTGCEDGNARLWDAASGKPHDGLLTHRGPVWAAVFSPDGKTLLTGSHDETARLWGADGKPVGLPLPHPGPVWAVAFSPDGKALLTGTRGGAFLWEPATGKRVGSPLAHPGNVRTVAFSRDGRTALTGGGEVRLWDVGHRGELDAPLWQASARAAAFSPDGRTVAGGDSVGSGWVRDTAGGKAPQRTFYAGGGVMAIAFRPDGKALLTGIWEKKAQLWDPATGKPLTEPLSHAGPVYSVAFSPDGRTALTGSADGTARLWDTAGQPRGEPLRHGNLVYLAAFSPDGKTVLTAGEGPDARLWDKGGRALGKPLVHRGRVPTAAFSPDGRFVLTGSQDQTARLWDATTGEPRGPPLAHPHHVTVAIFSRDGATFLTNGDKNLRLWQTATGRPLGTAFPHENGVSAAVFSRDGKTLLTACWEGTLHFWDFATRKPLGPVLRHPGINLKLDYAPDGKAVLAVDSSVLRCWEAPRPLAGTTERVTLWTEVETGLALDEDGSVRPLPPRDWHGRRRRLADLGGPPVP